MTTARAMGEGLFEARRLHSWALLVRNRAAQLQITALCNIIEDTVNASISAAGAPVKHWAARS